MSKKCHFFFGLNITNQKKLFFVFFCNVPNKQNIKRNRISRQEGIEYFIVLNLVLHPPHF